MSVSPKSSMVVLLLLVALTTMTLGDEYGPSVHDVLRRHGLPEGLFPESVKSYTLDHHTGLLEVHMDRPCLAQYETRVFFDRVVRANLTNFGQMKVMEGMSREELFLWFPVKGISVSDPSSGIILIDIGLAFKHLSRSRFDYSPECQPPGFSLETRGRKGLGFMEQR